MKSFISIIWDFHNHSDVCSSFIKFFIHIKSASCELWSFLTMHEGIHAIKTVKGHYLSPILQWSYRIQFFCSNLTSKKINLLSIFLSFPFKHLRCHCPMNFFVKVNILLFLHFMFHSLSMLFNARALTALLRSKSDMIFINGTLTLSLLFAGFMRLVFIQLCYSRCVLMIVSAT